MKTEKKLALRSRRRQRIRERIRGVAGRPRMSVKFSNQHIYVQFVDDVTGHTLGAVSTRTQRPPEGKVGANVATARWLGAVAAAKAKEVGIDRVVFDRSGARYHGKVKALADAAREGGLRF
ncbi:MAG: 50S ribosomal protein L18 [Verrucomicrobia bacterium]|jgi:large subunit ribosomal protein L18|nr:50S ribosomal protein L18 [Verrucomicrobiota bacterium]